MEIRRPSRNNQIDIEKCLKNFENMYELILTAARRTRVLQRHSDPWGLPVTPIDALLEAQSGSLKSEDYLDKKDSISPEEWYRRRMMNVKNRHSFSFGQ